VEGGRSRSEGGVTLIELLIAITVLGTILTVGMRAYVNFNEALTGRKAARLIAADVALTRFYAIQRRSNVALVADEATMTYMIRAADGTVLRRRYHDVTSALPLDLLDIQLSGDSLVFNARGLLAGAAAVEIEVGRNGRNRTIRATALGRAVVGTVD